MALLKTKEIREMSDDERKQRLKELRNELMRERGGTASMGGALASPGRIKAIRKNIARILTIQHETKKKEIKKK